MNTIPGKILLIEDEPKLAAFIKRGLEENGLETDVSYDGELGSRMAKSGNYSLYILDVNLPYKNGIEICKELRQQNKNSPVLMLTALGSTEDKLLGFDAGADDYLLKPFEFLELLARVKALLKRVNADNTVSDLLRFADIELDLNLKLFIMRAFRGLFVVGLW